MTEYYLKIIENAECEAAMKKMHGELFGIKENDPDELYEEHKKKYIKLMNKKGSNGKEEKAPSCFYKSRHLLYLKELLKN